MELIINKIEEKIENIIQDFFQKQEVFSIIWICEETKDNVHSKGMKELSFVSHWTVVLNLLFEQVIKAKGVKVIVNKRVIVSIVLFIDDFEDEVSYLFVGR